jgi:hypothetical protein
MRRPLVLVTAGAAAACIAAAVFAALYFTKSTTTTAPCGEQRLFGHIRGLTHEGNQYKLRFDSAVVTTGVTASVAAGTPGEPVPNDMYVVDDSHGTLLYLVSPSAHVTVLTPEANVDGAPITVSELAELVAGEQPVKLFEPLDSGVWIQVHVDTICSLEQQYRP